MLKDIKRETSLNNRSRKKNEMGVRMEEELPNENYVLFSSSDVIIFTVLFVLNAYISQS